MGKDSILWQHRGVILTHSWNGAFHLRSPPKLKLQSPKERQNT